MIKLVFYLWEVKVAMFGCREMRVFEIQLGSRLENERPNHECRRVLHASTVRIEAADRRLLLYVSPCHLDFNHGALIVHL